MPVCVTDWEPETYRIKYEASVQSRALLCSFKVPQNDWRLPPNWELCQAGVYTDLPMPKGTQCPCERSGQKWAKHVDQTSLSQSPFPVFDHSVTAWGIRTPNLNCWIIDFQGTCDPCCCCVLLLRPQAWNSHENPDLLGVQSGMRWNSSFSSISLGCFHMGPES